MKRLSMRSLIGWRWVLALIGLSFFIGLAGSAAADTIVQGFKTSSTLEPGRIVALSKSASDTVELAPAKDSTRIYGVVIDPSQAPVTLQRQGQEVFVASSGTYPVTVSNQSGPIAKGDYISLSSTDGIAAKASTTQPYVLGQAIESFDGKNGVISTIGGLAIGRINVAITPGQNPTDKKDVAVPKPLQRVGQAIAGKSVSAIRLYAAAAVFLAAAFIATSLLWIGVRSGMIAIGRNPLSKHSIIGSLIQVVIVAAIVFIIGLFAVYLLLKL